MLLLLSAALAASPADELGALMASEPPAAFLVSCSPLSALVERLGGFSETLAAEMDAEDQRAMAELLDAERAAAAGVDLSGSLLIGMWPDKGRIEIPFSGDRAQAEALLRRMVDEAEGEGEVRPDGEGWVIVDDEDEPVPVSLANGRLTMRMSEGLDEAKPGASWALLQDLPAGAGCAIYVGGFGEEREKLRDLNGVMMFIPLEPSTFVARFGAKTPPPASFQGGAAALPEIRTATAPSAVVTLGVDPLALAAELPLPPAEDGTSPQEKLAQLRRRVSIPPGASIAVFAPKRFAGVVPVAKPNGKPMSWRKIRRGIKKTDGELEWTGRRTFRVEARDTPLEGAVERGRVLLASDADLLAELSAGEGQPWLTTDMAAWAAQWPVSVVGSPPAGAGGFGGFTLYAGLRATPDYWEVAATIPGGIPAPLRAMMRGIAESKAPDGLGMLQHRAQRAEVPAHIDGIHNAEIAYNAAIGGYVGTEPAPRAVDALTADEAAWPEGSPAAEAWLKLGWRPDGDTRATYWVEVSPDGSSFTVHGMIDADGDGVPAHYQRTLGGEVEQLTGEDVY